MSRQVITKIFGTMVKLSTIFFVVIICISFIGCANTRTPEPCPMKTDIDANMTCDQITAEYMANTTSAENKISKNNAGDTQDVLLGLLIWPGLADFKNADGTEGNALLDRNLYLLEIAKTKECKTNSLPHQPLRYH